MLLKQNWHTCNQTVSIADTQENTPCSLAYLVPARARPEVPVRQVELLDAERAVMLVSISCSVGGSRAVIGRRPHDTGEEGATLTRHLLPLL